MLATLKLTLILETDNTKAIFFTKKSKFHIEQHLF